MRVDLRAAGQSDDLTKTVNYSEAYAAARDIVTGPPSQLIEVVAERIAERLLSAHPTVESVLISVRKPEVPIAGSILGSAEVVIERSRGE
jgi:dihydroneopterin aldolase